jgi:hypothetical protein
VADPPPYPGTPRWLRMLTIAGTAALMLLVLVHVIGGPHHNLPIVGSQSSR